MAIDSADDSKISNRTINTNRISNRTYDSKSNRITKLRGSLLKRTLVIIWGSLLITVRCLQLTIVIRKNFLYRMLFRNVYKGVGHILRPPTTRPASLAIIWKPEGGRRSAGRPKRTCQDTLKEDLDTLGVDANDARDTANDRARWRQLVAQCSDQNGRN